MRRRISATGWVAIIDFIIWAALAVWLASRCDVTTHPPAPTNDQRP